MLAMMPEQIQALSLADVFRCYPPDDEGALCPSASFQRTRLRIADGIEVLLDKFAPLGAQCAFIRAAGAHGRTLKLALTGTYHLHSVAGGGWLLAPTGGNADTFWVPESPRVRALDGQGHILAHGLGSIIGFDIAADGMGLALRIPPDRVLDLVVWRFRGHDTDLVQALRELNALETQPYFLWSSHTTYARPADLYLHLIHGNVYENHEVWPKYWRVCSELDAYALYVTLTGLLRATQKRLYDLLRTQVVFSVIARQAEDGGWYHGEWTDQMESHYRLHAGGMHMLAAYFEETRDPSAAAALMKATAFAASRTDRLNVGMWYLHDSLEESQESLRKYPFRYASSRALGKSPSNLLVLNTHLDTNIAMERSRRVTGDARHEELIGSARAATKAVLALRPAEWIYRPLFKAIYLTFLPSKRAAALPLPQRALKRIAWKYLAPQLARIKARFPRLVMPGGYTERGLSQYDLSVRYQPVNLMDLIRTRRMFDEGDMDALLDKSFTFTQQSGIKDRWKEKKGKEDDSLGFWAEALYHLCLLKANLHYRAWLAEAIMDLEDNGLGLPPSLLGANSEAISLETQCPCPSPTDGRLRVANLSHGNTVEWLVVNPTDQPSRLRWERSPKVEVLWHESNAANVIGSDEFPEIAQRAWIYGIGKRD